jgi:hypothetical protein
MEINWGTRRHIFSLAVAGSVAALVILGSLGVSAIADLGQADDRQSDDTGSISDGPSEGGTSLDDEPGSSDENSEAESGDASDGDWSDPSDTCSMPSYQKFWLSDTHHYWAEPATGSICMTAETSEYLTKNMWKLAEGLYAPEVGVWREGFASVFWWDNVPIGPHLWTGAEEVAGTIEIYSSSSKLDIFSPSNLKERRQGEKLIHAYITSTSAVVSIPKCSPAFVAMIFKVAGVTLYSPVVQIREGEFHKNQCPVESPASEDTSSDEEPAKETEE